jgi:hypothetical protein
MSRPPRSRRHDTRPQRSRRRRYLYLFCFLYFFLVLYLAAYGIPKSIIETFF